MALSLGVLSRNREFFPTAQLLSELDQMNDVSGLYLSTQYISPLISPSNVDALFATQSLRSISGVIPRIGRSQTEIGILCLQQFELMEIPMTLSPQALFISRDKFRCYQVLKGIGGIKFPKTILVSNSYMFKKLIAPFKFPIVIKIPDATQGLGTILVTNRRVAQEIIEALFLRYNTPIMIQEYLRKNTSNTKQLTEDIRVLVVGDLILGAMRRIAPQGEWRTNYSQGAICKPYQLETEIQELIHQIVNIIGIEVAGIDLFPTDKGIYVLEVNACPGWKAFEETYPHIRVAKNIIEYLIAKIRC
jgi:ribosomal protein S6--L-glutamate ligase